MTVNSSAPVFAVLLLVLPVFAVGSGPLDEQLNQIDGMRNGERTPFDQVEQTAAKLLQQYTDSQAQGKIHFMLAHVYAQTGQLRPDKTIAHAKKALQFPLDPAKRQLLHMYWGDALQLKQRGVRGERLAAVRREAVIPYLQALKELLPHNLPDKPSELPPLAFGSSDGPLDSTEYSNLLHQRQRQLAARERVQFQGEMIRYRDMQTAQIVYMYTRMPFATDELKTLATNVLDDEHAVRRIVDKVQAKVRQRLNDMGAKPLTALPKDIEHPLGLDAPPSPAIPSNHPSLAAPSAERSPAPNDPPHAARPAVRSIPLIASMVVALGTLLVACVFLLIALNHRIRRAVPRHSAHVPPSTPHMPAPPTLFKTDPSAPQSLPICVNPQLPPPR